MTIPTDAKAFAKWRKKQKFATPELASKAQWVETDLKILEKFTDPVMHANTRAVILKNLSEFVEMMKAGGG